MAYFSERRTNYTNIFQRLITPMEAFRPSKNQPMYGNQIFLYLAFFRRTYQINPLDASYQNSLCSGEYHIWKLLLNCPWSKIKLYHFVFYTLECVQCILSFCWLNLIAALDFRFLGFYSWDVFSYFAIIGGRVPSISAGPFYHHLNLLYLGWK